MSNYREKLKKVNTFIFDYDGVFSDGIVYLTADGEALRTANVKDGYALQLARKNNYNIAVISGGYSMSIVKRFENLKLEDIFLGVEKKIDVYNDYLKKKNVLHENVLFMGDDIPDLEIMQVAGVTTCPLDAANEIKEVAMYISHLAGGQGCVRDVIEQVLKLQGKWLNHDAYNW